MESVRLDFDASIKSGELYVGFLVKDVESGEVIDKYGRNTLAAQDSTQGELIALLHGIRYTVDKYNPTHIELYGDSHSVIEMMTEKSGITPTKEDMKQLVNCTYQLLYSTVESFNTHYIPSHENDAHAMANKLSSNKKLI